LTANTFLVVKLLVGLKFAAFFADLFAGFGDYATVIVGRDWFTGVRGTLVETARCAACFAGFAEDFVDADVFIESVNNIIAGIVSGIAFYDD